MEKGNDLRILQKTEDMILYANKALEQFPRSERYALAADIKRTMYSFYRLIITANKKYYKKTTLQDADVELEVLRGLIRLAANKEMRYLPMKIRDMVEDALGNRSHARRVDKGDEAVTVPQGHHGGCVDAVADSRRELEQRCERRCVCAESEQPPVERQWQHRLPRRSRPASPKPRPHGDTDSARGKRDTSPHRLQRAQAGRCYARRFFIEEADHETDRQHLRDNLQF